MLPGLHHQPALFLADHRQVDFGYLGAGVFHQLRQHMNRQRPPERDYGHLEAVAQALARGLSALDMGAGHRLLDQAPGREPLIF